MDRLKKSLGSQGIAEDMNFCLGAELSGDFFRLKDDVFHAFLPNAALEGC